jgi:hypothetical protein
MPRPSKRLPAWDQEDAILALVEDEFRGGGGGSLEQWYELQQMIGEDIFGDEAERGPSNEEVLGDAFQKAQGGEIRQLAALLRTEHPLNDELCERPIRAELSDEMWDFLADVLEGIRNLRNGKLKGQPGRPKGISEEAQEKRRIYRRAESDFRTIRSFLSDLYPEQTSGDIRDLALKFAAARHKVDREALWTYYNRPKNRK